MSEDVTTAARIAGRGQPITLSDGSTVRLRYSMLSMEALEADFGDMAAIQEHVNNAVRALEAVQRRASGEPLSDDDRKLLADGATHGNVFTQIVRVILPGLLDERAVDPRTPDAEPVWLEGRPDVAKRLLDPSRLREYMAAFRAAFVEAFAPAGEQQPAAGGAVPPPVPTPPSPGPTGTTSHAVSPVAQMVSSGA